jgi:hypothetical protein
MMNHDVDEHINSYASSREYDTVIDAEESSENAASIRSAEEEKVEQEEKK